MVGGQYESAGKDRVKAIFLKAVAGKQSTGSKSERERERDQFIDGRIQSLSRP